MLGVPREVTEHKIKVKPDNRPVRQKLHRFSPEKTAIIKDNLEKLLAVGFIREIHHPNWLANPIIVKKKGANGGCVSTTPASILLAPRTTSRCLGSISSSMPR